MLSIHSKAARIGSTGVILAGFLGIATLANAGTKNNTPPPPPPRQSAPASRPAPAQPAYRPTQPASRPAPSQPTYRPNQPSTNRPNQPSTVRPSQPSTSNPRGNIGGAGAQGNHPSTQIAHPSAPRPTVAKGTTERHAPSGSTVRMRANGKPSDIHDAKRGMTVNHGLNGGRRVSVEDRSHNRTVYQKGRAGYVQHPYKYGPHEFVQRTYVSHGRVYSRSYMGYPYHGAYLSIYTPGVFYSPYFYGWAYNPWASPIMFGWGFAGSPWYGYYGYYFSPFESYPSASYWLTDYMISSDLQADYAAHTEAGETDGEAPAVAGPPMLTPEVKQQIANEVRNELALENNEATRTSHQLDVDPGSSGIDRLMSDAANGKSHVFVVGASLDVVDATQAECSLSDGDVLVLQTAPPADAPAVDLVVLASKGGQECQKQATVSVALADLQEMQNHMRESIDQGLQELQAKQGKGGLPALPSTVQPQPAPAPYAAIAPPPDPNAATEIQQQAQQADMSEKEVTAEAAPGGSQ